MFKKLQNLINPEMMPRITRLDHLIVIANEIKNLLLDIDKKLGSIKDKRGS